MAEASATDAVQPQLVSKEGDITVNFTGRHTAEADLGELIDRYWYDIRFEICLDAHKSRTYCVGPEQAPNVRVQQLRLMDIAKNKYEVSFLYQVSKELTELQLESCEAPKVFITIDLKCTALDWKTPPQKVRQGITCLGYIIDYDEEFHYGSFD